MHLLLKQLLDLQALDQSAIAQQKQVQSLASEISRIQNKIEAVHQTLNQKQQAIHALEVQYEHNELQLHTWEELLIKQKTQQAITKKSGEYQALEKSIADLKQKIGELETELLNALDEIEHQRALYQSDIDDSANVINALKQQLQQLTQACAQAQSQYEEQQQALHAFESTLKGPFYEAYVILRKCTKAFPLIVPLTNGNRCSGCHLTVSNDTVARVTASMTPEFCEHCGRLLIPTIPQFLEEEL